MFKIGEFSKLSRVPTKTLRYYDEIGLLRPDRVDAFTGYRYYTLEQLRRANTILVLRDLDFSLAEIATMLDEALTPEQMRGMLRMKQAEIARRVAAEQARLARVEARLRQLEDETMPDYEIVIKQMEPAQALVVRDVIADYQHMGMLYAEVMEAVQSHGLTPTGPMFGIYYDDGYKETDVDVEVGIPVSGGSLPAGGRARIRTLDGQAQVASLLRKGPFNDFSPAYQALMTWIKTGGYEITGHAREIFLRGPGEVQDQNECLVEIQYPVRQATSR